MEFGIRVLDAAPISPIDESGPWIVIACIVLIVAAVVVYKMYKK